MTERGDICLSCGRPHDAPESASDYKWKPLRVASLEARVLAMVVAQVPIGRIAAHLHTSHEMIKRIAGERGLEVAIVHGGRGQLEW